MSEVATIVTESVRTCDSCGMEKPIEEFQTTYQNWHLRTCKQCVLARRREYYQAHREALIEKVKEYRQNNKESIRKQKHDYYLAHRDETIARVKKYHQEHWAEYYEKHSEVRKERSQAYYRKQRLQNKEEYGTSCSPERLADVREYQTSVRASNKLQYGYAYPPEKRAKRRQHFAELRTKALLLYGNKCECCGESRYEMLTFDHIVGSGYKTGIRGVKLVYDVIREYEESGYPNDKYQVLCWNCNMSRGFYGYCPHRLDDRTDYDYRGKATKLEMIEAYGGQCVLCGETRWEFLTIDHVNGGGSEHRRKVGSGGVTFYTFLKKQGWPKGDYRLLCSNCNCSVKRNRWSPREVEA